MITYILQEFHQMIDLSIKSKKRGVIIKYFDDEYCSPFPDAPEFEELLPKPQISFLSKRKQKAILNYDLNTEFVILFLRINNDKTDLFRVDLEGNYVKIN